MKCQRTLRCHLLFLSLVVPATGFAHERPDRPPSFLDGPVTATHYDGVGDDLLTAGLGASGLASATPPAVSSDPTAAEIRRLAIYNNYRALVPTDAGNGYGVFYGPGVDANGQPTGEEGLIAGTEYLAFAGPRSGRVNVTLMVQVPDSFDVDAPCLITAPSSGSRGIYGAIGTAGEWGLKHGCAVAYTDKGTGNGAYSLQGNRAIGIDGRVDDADALGKEATFVARMSPRQRERFNSEFPDRYAFKHAHSRLNPEQDWGRNVLQSIEFAFYVLNTQFGDEGRGRHRRLRFEPDNTLVIASSVSNGGGASVRAAELDTRGLIDGVAVSEPNVNPRKARFAIVQGTQAPLYDHSRSLFDYTTLLNVYQGCASLAEPTAPFNLAPSAEACTSLHEKGLLSAGTAAAQAAEAQQIINDAGWNPEQNIVQPSHWFLNVPQSISVTYANAYGRADVRTNLCGYSFAATDPVTGAPVSLAPDAELRLFGTGNGIPPTGGINLVNNASVGGVVENRVSVSPSSGRADQNLDGALCLRALATGRDPVTGERLRGAARAMHRHILEGIEQIRASGDLHGKPAIFVTGRNDAILAINHASRAYYGLNQATRGARSQLRYYEVTHAHHLDVLNALPGFAERFVPLHHYLFQGLDLMYAHLRHGTPLPPSQVVHTVPRGAGAPAIGPANLPDIDPNAPAADRIRFGHGTLYVPE
ncbi:D-(-)-3-hydroxybutyrate oligomer hydrolase [Nitrogeniibacter mangrovi]|uniref:D-(-)-3-hydroxybutyrate oligomer hydrolase n=1 Tax=Nitrogeniibacter mangrovi TaxID=2016596 RepID=A0A6C1B5J3_9RHOO|nr:3-hydroxybutyrate oligomer hydrolase family protein [Nitrogeniibacter mangrovi]QID17570.1 D-(-)-3-hydroxybutyrate oligomer hydrolase [Nitrogeniibacter mangrovi]